MSPDDIIHRDLEMIAAQVGADWSAVDGARIFVTGGTGFIGGWLLEALRHAAQAGRRFEITVLSRDPEKFRAARPHLADWGALTFSRGAIADFAFPDGGFNYLIHAATDASAALNRDDPRQMFETVVQGTRRALDFATDKKVRRMLFRNRYERPTFPMCM